MTRIVARIALAVCLAAAVAAPLTADEAAPLSPRFFIERIEVRGAKRVSPDIVISESRLRQGHEYSEADLRDASTRLQRLPFLLSAEFSLEKGSARGMHALVITINETKPFFFALDLRPIFTSDYQVDPDYSDHINSSDSSGTIGLRWFVGGRGALHVALISTDYESDFARDYGAVVVGYTQYDLLGTRAFATVNLKHVVAPGARSISPQVVVGVPLTGNQTLSLEYDETVFGDGDVEVLGEIVAAQRGQRIVGATWSYNTTNRPFLPTRGTLLSVQPRVSWADSTTYIVFPIFNPDTGQYEVHADIVHSQSRQIRGAAARYWELSERTSVSAGVEAAWTAYRADSEILGLTADRTTRIVLAGGYSYSLWNAERQRTGDSRLELNVRVGDRSINYYDFGQVDQQQASASWVRRSSWGTLRLGVGYAW